MKVQHGDVVGIRGAGKYDGAIEVILKPEGFGFGASFAFSSALC